VLESVRSQGKLDAALAAQIMAIVLPVPIELLAGQSESKGGALTQAAVAAAAAALKPQLEAGSKGQAPALPAKAASTVSDELAEATAASKIAVTK
ncbi:MAG TPA: hypothetical protein PK493_19585, partial [Pseudomonadota bacterium]|nr:hypothetical protein [Pseudomonadota bacterium]